MAVDDTIEPPPLINVRMRTQHQSYTADVLPDSGLETCEAGVDFLEPLGGECVDNLQDSHILPRAVNGQQMTPLGSIVITFKLGPREICQRVYRSVSGVLMSWKASRDLGILPDTYPQPLTAIQAIV